MTTRKAPAGAKPTENAIAAKKLCPIMSPGPRGGDIHCQGTGCAWYMPRATHPKTGHEIEQGTCVAVYAAWRLNRISDTLEAGPGINRIVGALVEITEAIDGK